MLLLLLLQPIDIHDVEKYLPGLIGATRHWFKVYKMPDGKPANKFAFKGACKDKVSGACACVSHKELLSTHVPMERFTLLM